MDKAPRSTFAGAVASFFIGIVYLVITLPRGTQNLGARVDSELLITLGTLGLRVNGWVESISPDFPELLTWVLWSILAYFVAVLLLALRHRQLGYVGWTLMTLVVSTAIFHVIAWGGFILIIVLRFLLRVLSFLSVWLTRIIAAITVFLIDVALSIISFLNQLLEPLLGAFWWLGAIAILFVLAFVIFKFRLSFAAALRRALQLVGSTLLAGGVFFVILWLLGLIVPYLERILAFLGRIFAFLLRIAGYVIAFLAIVIAIATIGQLLLDQFKGATFAGNKRRGVIMGAMAIGTTLAVLLLVSNVYGTNSWLPDLITQISGSYLHMDAPIVDAILAIAIIGVSIFGVLRNLPRLRAEPTMSEFGKSLVYQAVGLFVAGALVAVGTVTEGDS